MRLRLARSGERRPSWRSHGHVGEDVVLGLPVVIVGGRDAEVLASREDVLGRGVRDDDDPLRLGEGKRLEQDRVDDAENGRVRPDAQGEHADRDGGEPGALAERAERVPEVLTEIFHAH